MKQVRLSQAAETYLENISKMIGVDNHTRIVNSSIQMADEVFTVLKEGGKVQFKRKDGTIENLRLIIS